jgi:two-component system, cell cycle response regulator
LKMPSDLKRRVILIDSYEDTREVLATRLRAQGYVVDPVGDSATGANMALSDPPSAVVADLWMPSISGVQICRLLRSEPATADVPVILRGETDDPKSRFWAERAGAAAYVAKGRIGDLVRALDQAIAAAPETDGFFLQLSGGTVDIRDRIAQHLDTALFESVIAAEVRALASAGGFERLFDMLSQLLSQLGGYRWLAVSTTSPEHFAVHHHPKLAVSALAEARAAFGIPVTTEPFLVQDEDALPDPVETPPKVCPITFGDTTVGKIAVSAAEARESDTTNLLPLVARDLGGPLRMAALIEESQRQAATDLLTGLMNRRAFLRAMDAELARCTRHGHSLSVLLLDVDHFKPINDQRGHLAGDHVLAALGKLLDRTLRKSDLAARWGGEEFVAALTNTGLEGGRTTAERLRKAVEMLEVRESSGEMIPVTASVGLATWEPGEKIDDLIERADRAMYAAKSAGRNRAVVAEGPAMASEALLHHRSDGEAGEPPRDGLKDHDQRDADA